MVFAVSFFLAVLDVFFSLFLKHFNKHCHLSDSTVLEDAGIEPGTVATYALVQ